MKTPSLASAARSVRVFVVCLLLFNICIAPIGAMAASLKQRPEVRGQRSEKQESGKAAAEDVFAHPLEVKPETSLPNARPEPAPLPLAPLVGSVTSSLSATLAAGGGGVDADADGKADPGDTIAYTLSLANTSGAGATGLAINNPLDSHTTLSGSVQSTPIAFDQSVSLNEDATLVITLTGQDPDGSNLTFKKSDGTNFPSNPTTIATTHGTIGTFGSVTCDANGVCSQQVTYTPAANYNGADSFSFKANDGTANSNENGVVTINVIAVNDAPTFTVPGSPAAVNEDAGLTTVTDFISEVRPAQGLPTPNTTEDTQTVSFVITNITHSALFTAGGQPVLTVQGAGVAPFPRKANLTYTPAPNANGTSVVTYHLHDTGGTSPGVDNSADQTFTITVNAVNDAPVALTKAFTVQANMKITGLTGLLTGVTDADATNGTNDSLSFDAQAGYTSPVATVTSVTLNTCTNGTISNLNASTGTFDFDPPPGLAGGSTCVLSYQVTDTKNPAPGAVSATQTITITAQGPAIWFVNPGAAPETGDGRLSTPFKLLSSANAKLNTLGTNQKVFVYTGSTAIGASEVLDLKSDNDWLVGQGTVAPNTATPFDSYFSITPPAGTIARPTMVTTASAGNAARPTVRGTVTMRNNTQVTGVNIDVTGAAAGSKGISGVFTSGTSLVKDVNVTSAAGNAVDVSGSQTFTYVTSDGTNSPNILSSTTGTALSAVNTTIGASGMTFQSINHNASNSGTNSAIILNNTGSGTFTVTGTGGTCTAATPTCTGGKLQNIQGADAISLNTTGGLVTLNNMLIQNISAANDTTDAINTRSGIDGIQGQAVSGGLTVNTSVFQNISDSGINGSVGGAGVPSATSWNGLTVTNSTFTNMGRFNVANKGDATNEAGVYMLGIKGTVSVTNNSFSNAPGGLLFTTDTSGTLDMTATGNTFTTMYKDIGTQEMGLVGISVTQAGSLSSIIRIGDKDDANPALGNTFTNGGGVAALIVNTTSTATGSTKVEVNRNTSTVTDHTSAGTAGGSSNYNFPQGGFLLSPQGSGNYEAIVGHNTFDQVMHANGAIGQLSIFTSNGTAEFLIQNNTFNKPWDAPVQIKASADIDGSSTTQVLMQSNTYISGIVGNAGTDVGGPTPFDPNYFQALNGGRLDLTIKNETFATPDPAGLSSHGFYVQTTSTGDILNLFLQNTTSTSGYELKASLPPAPGATFNLYRNGSVQGTAQGVLNDNGNSGNAFLTGAGTVNLSNTAPTLPNITVALLSPKKPGDDRAMIDLHPGRMVGTNAEIALAKPVSIEQWIGHKLGLADSYLEKDRDNLMYGYMTVGERRLPARDEAKGVLPNVSSMHFLSLEPNEETAAAPPDVRKVSDAPQDGSLVSSELCPEPGAQPNATSDNLTAGQSRHRTSDSGAAIWSGVASEARRRFGSIDRIQSATTVSALQIAARTTEGSKPQSGAMSIAPTQKNRGQRSEVRSQRSDVRLNHARANSKLETRNAQPIVAPLMPTPVGSFPINGTGLGAGFSLPDGKSITITFKATLNSPPNFASYSATQKITAQATLTGSFVGNPLSSDDPAVVGGPDVTSTTVDLYDSTTTLSASPSNSTNTGQAVTFTATIGTSGTPSGSATNRTGTVNFRDNGVSIGCDAQTVSHVGANDVATCTTSSLLGGVHSNVTAAYSGNGNFDPSTSSAFTQTVTANGTTTAMLTSGSPSLVSQSVTFTAQVTSTGAVSPPTGTVQFQVDGVNSGSPVALTSGGACPAGKGCASFSSSSLNAAGSPHAIKGTYIPDAAFTASNNTVSQTVNKSGTQTGIASSQNPSFVGQGVSFTATVSSLTAVVPPTGSVNFHEGATNFGTVALSTGGGCPVNKACATSALISSLSAGPHTITADYLGDTTFNSSTINLSQQVNKSNTTMTVTSAPASPTYVGQSVTITVKIISSDTGTIPGPPTGTVKFWDGPAGGTQIGGDVALTAGGACPALTACADSAAISTLTANTHTITVQYLGDATFSANSGTKSQVVNKSDTEVSLVSSGATPNVGDPVTFTATIQTSTTTLPLSPVAFDDGGTVDFKDGSTIICAARPISASHQATCVNPALPAGPHNISAVYSGDPAFNGNTSNTVTQQVGPVCPNAVVVTSAADNGAGTLRQAIADVCDGGTITFDSTTFAAPGPNFINLIDAGGAGIGGELLINKSVTINGPAAGILTVRRDLSAATNFRVFEIGSGKTVTITGMTISNGNATGLSPASGGGIYNDHGTLTLTSCVVSGNTADTGGGINANGATAGSAGLTLTATTVSGNTANTSGGGVYIGAAAPGSATVVIDRVTFSGNNAGLATNGSGGGLDSNGAATLTIKNSTFSGNKAGASGGGMRVDGGPTTLTGVTITGNFADNDNDNTGTGGGLDVVTGPFTLQNTIVAGNFKGVGSGMMQQETGTVIGSITSGTQQIDVLTIGGGPVATCSGSGNIKLTVTAAGMPGSGTPVLVPVNEIDTAAQVTDAIVTFLSGGGAPAITSYFTVTKTAATELTFTRKAAADTDPTMSITLTDDTCTGITSTSDSTTTPGASSGSAKVVVTSTGMAGSPLTISVPVAKPDNQDDVASKMRAALAANSTINARFTVSGSTNQIILTRIISAPNDPNLNIETNNDTCTGLTGELTSADTTGGTAAASPNDISGTVDPTSSYNLIGDALTAGGLIDVSSDAVHQNQVGSGGSGTVTTSSVLDVNLADNGGPTRTHKLVAGSPAIEKGKSFGLTNDQRGFLRPVDDGGVANASGGDGSDIGAFEIQGPTPTPTLALTSIIVSGTTTRDSTPDFLAGNLITGATIKLLRDDDGAGGASPAVVLTTTAPAATMSLTDNTLLTDGSFIYSVTQTVGSDTQASADVPVIVDTRPTTPDLLTADDTFGPNGTNTDDITKVTTPTFTGTADKNTTVQLFADGNLVGSAISDNATGAWSITSSALSATTHSITAKEVIGSFVGAASTALPVTIDNTVAPPSTPVLFAADDSGTTGDNTTNVNTPRLTGTAEPGSTVTLFSGVNPIGAGTADNGGNWTITINPALPDNTYQVTAQATDVAGNVSALSGALNNLVIDIAAPATPSQPDLIAADDTGAFNNDNVTNKTTPSFTGTAEANSTVKLYANDGGGDVEVGSATATGGSWSITTSTLAPNTYQITARASDAAGNTSSASTSLGVTIDNQAPNAPSTPDLIAADDTGALDTDNITKKTTPAFSGSAEANSTVKLYANNGGGDVEVGSTTATGGNWNIASSALADGTYQISAKATDLAGNQSVASTNLQVVIDTQPPVAPSTPVLNPADDTGTSNSDGITKKNTPNFTGTAEAGSTVQLFAGATPVGSALATGGNWNITSGLLPDNPYSVIAQATDLAGNTSVSSGAFALVIDTAKPTVTMSSAVGNPTATTPIPVTVQFSEPVTGFTLGAIIAANGTTGNFAGSGANYSFDLTPTAAGGVSADIAADVATDTAGNGNTAAVQFNRTFDPSALNATITAITPNPRNAAVTSIQIVFNKPVTGFDLADLTLKLNNGANLLTGAQTLNSADNATWTLDNLAGITAAQGTYDLKLTAAGSNIQDATSTALASDATASWITDTTAPTVTLEQAVGQADPLTGPTGTTIINFTATFAEPVTGLTPSGVTIFGTANPTIVNVTGSGTTYNLAVQGMSQSGTVRASINASAATDDAGNGNALSTSADNTVQFNADNFLTLEVNSTADPGDGVCDPIGTGDGCTLREAINAANADFGADTITFNSTVFAAPGPYTINLSTTLPDITTDMTIQGPGATVLTVKGFAMFFLPNNASVNISGLTLTNGTRVRGGAILMANGTLTLTNLAVTGNTALEAGGGIYVGGGTLNIISSTISGNHQTALADGDEGGGGICNNGQLTVTNTTISGNDANNGGGGLAVTQGSATLANTTVAANTAQGWGGGGIVRRGGTVTLKSTIVGDNTNVTGPDVVGAINSDGFNLIENTTGATITPNGGAGPDIIGLDPGLNPLADNGGQTFTHSLLCTSPAIDKGKAFGLTADQRGGTRPFDFADAVYPNAVGGDGSDIGAYETQSAGGCVPTAVPPSPAPSTNEETPVVITLTGTYSQNINLSFSIPQNPTIGQLGAISAPNCVFAASMTCTATVTYTPNANANGADVFKFKVSAGGLDSDPEDVNVTVNPINDAPSFSNSGTQTVAEDAGPQTVANFANSISPGPPDESGQAVQFIVTNNTNAALFSAAPAIDPAGTLTFTSAPNAYGSAQITVVLKDNGGTGGGNVDTSAPQAFTINVTGVADTPSVSNATTTVNAQTTSGLVISRNAADAAEVTYFQITNITNGKLFLNDGTSQIFNDDFITFAEGNAGLKFTPALNSNTDGSFQVQSSLDPTVGGLAGGAATATVTLTCGPTVVTNSNDTGAGSLRDIILHACAGATITFDMTPGNVTSPITLTSSELLINKSLTINGPGANVLTVQRSAAVGTPLFRILRITGAATTANISGLTISNGNVNGDGGAIQSLGTLSLSAVIISGNHAQFGAGIDSAGTLNLDRATISGNQASGAGGAVYIESSGLLMMTNSTISGNQASQSALVNVGAGATILNSTFTGNSNQDPSPGAAIFGFQNSVTNLTNCTVAQNVGQSYALFQNPGGSLNLKNSIVSGNTGGDVFNVNNNGNNLIGGNALLAALGNYGGPTQTMALLPGSPAIDAGDNAAITNPAFAGPPFTDQRGAGFNRIANGTVDIGAFESRGFTIAVTSGNLQSAVFNTAFGAPLVATVSSAFSEPVSGGEVTFTAPASGASATFTGGVTTINVAANASGQASVSATANAIAGGPYSVIASGNGIAGSANFNLTNLKAASNTAVSSSVNPSDLNQSVTFTATVTSTAGTPTGTVQFKDNGNNLGAPAAVNASGVAQFATTELTTGTHTITGDYIGDGNFLSSTGTLSGGQVVNSQPSLSINDVSIVEGDAGTKVLNFTVTLSAASSLTVTTNYATANGTATAPSDYTAIASTSLTFNPGDTSKQVSVTINGDINFEPDETFFVNLSNPVNATISDNQGLGTIQNDDVVGGFISFGQANYNVSESSGVVTVTVTRTNDVSQAVQVDYATDDTGASTNCAALNTGLASQRCDYISLFGTLKFAANETQKTIDIPINLDAYTEGPETFTVKLSNPTSGAVLALPTTATVTISDSASPAPNAIDDTTTFVRQQYRDFLDREADPAGLAFWKNNIDKCNDPAQRPPGQTLVACIEVQRILTSAAFFLSIEFKGTGGLVRDFYVAALDRPLTNNMPGFVEFMRDAQGIQKGVVVGQGNWQQVLEANRTAFMNEFVMRAEFVALYPTTDTPTQYVDKLYQHANVTGTQQERLDAIDDFGGAATAADPGARARALLRVTQNGAFQAREMNRGFVQIQYFGYLRRNPNDPPDNNFNGFNFWVNKLNQFNGDFLQAEMVKAFISSLEYRGRFGP